MRQSVEPRAFWMLVAIATLLISFGWGRVGIAPAHAEVISATVGAG